MVERWRPVSGGTAVVSASDYDALEGLLGETVKTGRTRIRELEAALRDCVDADSEPYGGSVRAEAIYRARQLLTAPETFVVCPDWGGYHNFNAGRCSCGESNAQTYVSEDCEHG